jgi:hypothetical protein
MAASKLTTFSRDTDDWLTPAFLNPSKPSQEPSDYRFTYVGPAHTFTPFHRDVFRSYSWSANVVGRKRWLMVRPEDAERFRTGGNMMFDLRELEQEGSALWERVLKVEQQVRDPADMRGVDRPADA